MAASSGSNPSRVDPRAYGLDLYYPTQWQEANDQHTNATIDSGTALQIRADRGFTVPAKDVLVADFENSYPQGWTTTSVPGHLNLFGAAPAQSTWTGQYLVPEKYVGHGFVNTFQAASNQGDNDYQGILSGNIVIQKNYLHLLVAGGADPANTVVRLRVGGQIVASTTGDRSATLKWHTWNVSAYRDQNATVEIVDTSSGGWGFIMCDEIVQSDQPSPVLYPNTENAISRYGSDFGVDDSAVTGWGDWSVDFQLKSTIGTQKIDVTLARGIPFTWTTWENNLRPRIMVDATNTALVGLGGGAINTAGDSFVASAFAFVYQGHTYGVFLPDNTTVVVGNGYLEPMLSGADNYLVVGYLPDASYLAEFNNVAFARPYDTLLKDWDYQPGTGYVSTSWQIKTTALKGSNLNTIQGWLPHHYRTTKGLPTFSPYTYQTARGLMKCTTGTDFTIQFPFNGLVPTLPAPVTIPGEANPYRPTVMQTYLSNFDPGSMIGDTYWSGKALALCSQYMAWAKETGNTAVYDKLKGKLETAFQDWMTYTPNEENLIKPAADKDRPTPAFFTVYPDWHAFIGFGASYGSQCFNDLHFHYGYFTTAAATLAMYDPAFVADYKEMLEKIAKAYANYDRTDTSEPFLRMFDVWEGHSNAGGMGNGNGQNQESSSEAMQGWAGLYLLGGTTNNTQMAKAGAMGFAMEAAATNEYWEDIWNENFPKVYQRAFAGQVYGDSYNYGTFFSGDPAWVYAIQYGPSNHWLNYLTRYNPQVVSDKYDAMWPERTAWAQSQTPWVANTAYRQYQWVVRDLVIYGANQDVPATSVAPKDDPAHWDVVADCRGSEPSILGDTPGHVVHAYEALFNPNRAAAEFDRYLASGDKMVAANTQAGSTYYLIHSMRQAGQQDYTASTDALVSSAYKNPVTGEYSYFVYNPEKQQKDVTVYRNGAAVGTFPVPAQSMIASHLDQRLTTVNLTTPNKALTIQPGDTITFTLTGYDQYKATYPLGAVNWTASGGGTIRSAGPTTAVFTATTAADVVEVSATSGGLSPVAPYKFRVGAKPVLSGLAVTPGFARVIKGSPLTFSATGLDQYNDPISLDGVTWTTGGTAGSVSTAGVYTATTVGTDYVTATSGGVSSSGVVAVHAALTNVAQGRPVVVSSVRDLNGNLGPAATDGDINTRWESKWADNQSISVDLGKTYDLDHLSIDWEDAYAANYEVQYSLDGTTWTAALDGPVVSEPRLGKHRYTLALTGKIGRFLRLQLNTRIETHYGFSLYEIQVYGYVNAVSIVPTSLKVTPGIASTTTGLKT